MDTHIVTGTSCWRIFFYQREATAIVNWQSTDSLVHIYQAAITWLVIVLDIFPDILLSAH